MRGTLSSTRHVALRDRYGDLVIVSRSAGARQSFRLSEQNEFDHREHPPGGGPFGLSRSVR